MICSRTATVRPVPRSARTLVAVSALFAVTLLLQPGPAFSRDAVPAQPAGPTPSLDNETFKPESGQAGKDVIWVPTPDEIVKSMLDMVEIKPGDRHFDLGSGDGKIVIAAAKRGANSTGVEYNGDMVALSRRNAERAGVGDRARFVQGDIFETDFSNADVVTLYLLPTLNLRLRPTLLAMKPGTRIASHQFTMGDWEPDQRVALNGRDALAWVVPARIEGSWAIKVDGEGGAPLRADISQKYQRFSGQVGLDGAALPIDNGRIAGTKVDFAITDPAGQTRRFSATADGDGRLVGTVQDARGASRPFEATRTSAPPAARPASQPASVAPRSALMPGPASAS